MADYGAMKAGVMAFMRTFAKEHGRYGVRANSVCPASAQARMLTGQVVSVSGGARRAPNRPDALREAVPGSSGLAP